MSAKWLIGPIVIALTGCAGPKVASDFPASYRAAGNEPFWHLRVQEQTVTVDRPDVAAYSTQIINITPTEDGWQVQASGMAMQIQRMRCEDDMSGALFEHRVAMQLQGHEYRGCGGAQLPPDRLEQTQWLATEIRGQAVSAEQPPSLSIDGNGHVAGFDGCNRMAGGFSLEEDGEVRHQKPGWIATQMACVQPTMQLAERYGEALRAARQWRFDGAFLTLQDDKGAIVLRYQRTY